MGGERFDVTLKLETVFEQREIRDKVLRPRRFHFGDDGLQTAFAEGSPHCSCKVLDRGNGRSLWNACGASDAFQIGACSGRGWKSSHRQKAFIVENNVKQILRFVACQSAERAKVHQERTVAVEDHNFLPRL